MITKDEAEFIAKRIAKKPEKVYEYCAVLDTFKKNCLAEKPEERKKPSDLEDFRSLFADFFTMSSRNYDVVEFQNPYFKIMDGLIDDYFNEEKYLADPVEAVKIVLKKIYDKCKRVSKKKKGENGEKELEQTFELSYTTKMLHMFHTDWPIWDSVLVDENHFGARSFNLRKPTSTQIKDHGNDADEVVKSYAEAYGRYKKAFDSYKTKDDLDEEDINGNRVVECCRPIIQERIGEDLGRLISDTKILDFVLWLHRIPRTKVSGSANRALEDWKKENKIV